MRFWSTATPGSGATSEPVAMTMFLASSVVIAPSSAVTSTLPGPAILPAPLIQSTLFFLNRNSTPLVGRRAVLLGLIIAGRFSFGVDLDAELGEVLARPLEELGGVQQRLGRDAADVEAGAAQGRALLDAGDLQPSCPARIAAL